MPARSLRNLAARVLPVEHRIYPAVLNALARGRIRLENGRAVFSDDDAASLSRFATD
jgi:phosphoribosylglycinamide formyltransferase-1